MKSDFNKIDPAKYSTYVKLVTSASKYLPFDFLCEAAKSEVFALKTKECKTKLKVLPVTELLKKQEFLLALYFRLINKDLVKKESIELVLHYLKPIKKMYEFQTEDSRYWAFCVFKGSKSGVIINADKSNYEDCRLFVRANPKVIFYVFDKKYDLIVNNPAEAIQKGLQDLIELKNDFKIIIAEDSDFS